eukprot:COSAG06_NODE_18757_length_870_cov_1.412451_2_plen_93_part_01
MRKEEGEGEGEEAQFISRQARDKRKENSKEKRVAFHVSRFAFRVSRVQQGGFSGGPYMMGEQYTIADMCENSVFWSHFYTLNMLKIYQDRLGT